ncbi:MAG: hypothetical protein IPL32_05090 [Chloracidobacterium sp.]|nr:hypothetical protein [Chloracidobacterium sp.]
MKIEEKIRETLSDDWLPHVYKTKVRLQRTRSVHLNIAARENKAEILYTLLGIELKVGRRRFSCPDLATARYLRVFARIGCHDFAIPYDITQISGIADELETSWQRSLVLAEGKPSNRTALVKALRSEVNAYGPGDPMPLFDRETRQRKGEDG